MFHRTTSLLFKIADVYIRLCQLCKPAYGDIDRDTERGLLDDMLQNKGIQMYVRKQRINK